MVFFISLRPQDRSWRQIYAEIKRVIDRESKTNPLSDHAIVEELAKEGIIVARRTVTKYRKAMNIPSSRGRRDWTKGGK